MMTQLLVMIYNLTILAGTAYLVAIHDWSGWWFLFSILLLLNITKNDK